MQLHALALDMMTLSMMTQAERCISGCGASLRVPAQVVRK